MAEAGLLPEGASLYDPSNIMLMHHLYAGVRAHSLYHRDQHYVVQNDEVVIVDEFTGRMMQGRRWSDGLHQAVEAKEGVSIKNESQTLASITFQNYFRLYKKLAGMTGTADTEAFEFSTIYNLETVLIPTHRPMVRKDKNDQVFITAKEKYQAIINDVKDCARARPAGARGHHLGGELRAALRRCCRRRRSRTTCSTPSSTRAKPRSSPRPAARRRSPSPPTWRAAAPTSCSAAIPIPRSSRSRPTRRSTDAEKERAHRRRSARPGRSCTTTWWPPGGLHIIGSERHESRRIDNQLRGRSGRQGDPGSSRFYPLVRGPAAQDLRRRAPAGDHARAQDSRGRGDRGAHGHALHRERAAQGRGAQLRHPQAAARIRRRRQRPAQGDLPAEERAARVARHLRDDRLDPPRRARRDRARIRAAGKRRGAVGRAGRSSASSKPTSSSRPRWPNGPRPTRSSTAETIARPRDRAAREGLRRQVRARSTTRRAAQLRARRDAAVDRPHWREHLAALDYLRQGIHLRGYAQKQPKQEYKREAFELFGAMLDSIKREVTRHLMRGAGALAGAGRGGRAQGRGSRARR